jgi:hypothetical protein
MVKQAVRIWQDAVDKVAQKYKGPKKKLAEFVSRIEDAGYVYRFPENLITTDDWRWRNGKVTMYIDSSFDGTPINGVPKGLPVAIHITGHGFFGYRHEIKPGVFVGAMGESKMPTKTEGTITYVGDVLTPNGITNPLYQYSQETYEKLLELLEDFDGNGEVNIDDLFLFAEGFGKRKGEMGFNDRFDLDGDGEISFNDFFIYAFAFGNRRAYQALF